MADNKEASIVIKKIKKGGHAGHHGGAWKVAYADFVTAMMAFFLLLWLLQATAQSQKEGIAEYFTPTIGVRDAAGIGFKGGKTSYDEGRKVAEKSPPGIIVGRMPQGPTAQKQEKQAPVESTQDAYLFEKAEKNIKQAMEEDPNFRDFKDNVIVEQSPEGLKIEIIDDDKLPMFESKGTELTQAGEKILRLMSTVIKAMPNRISITGHTEATNYMESGTYSNWELTADRANAARRFLMTTDLEPARVAKVTGRADQELLDPKLPTSARNRRVTIILLRESYLKTLGEQTPAPQNLLTVPRPTPTQRREKLEAKPAAKTEVKPAPALERIPETKAEKTNVDVNTIEFKMPDTLKQTLNGGVPAPKTEDNAVSQSLLTLPKPTDKLEHTSAPAPKPMVKPTPPPAPPKPEETPETKADKTNVDSLSTEFKMPEALRRSLNGGVAAPNTENDEAIPSNLLSLPKPTDNLSGKPAPAPAPKPVAKPAPVPKPASAPVSEGDILLPDVDNTNVDSLPTEFKLPDALRRSMDATPAGTTGTNTKPAGTGKDDSQDTKANGGLNSLPSGLIQTDSP